MKVSHSDFYGLTHFGTCLLCHITGEHLLQPAVLLSTQLAISTTLLTRPLLCLPSFVISDAIFPIPGLTAETPKAISRGKSWLVRMQGNPTGRLETPQLVQLSKISHTPDHQEEWDSAHRRVHDKSRFVRKVKFTGAFILIKLTFAFVLKRLCQTRLSIPAVSITNLE